MCEKKLASTYKKEKIMARFLDNLLGLAVAVGTGSLMLAVAFV